MTSKPAAAVAYLRTFSATNTGQDKDSHKRQQAAISAYAKRHGLTIHESPFYDAAVSGSDLIQDRPGFAAMLSYLAEHPEIRTILVETASRFSRDLIVQETGYRLLQARGIELIAVDSPNNFLDDTPTAVMVRQILGAFAQFDKAMTVAKLRGARDRKRSTHGKCEGRKSIAETQPEVAALARKLYRRNPATGQRRSMREIAEELTKAGHRNSKGNAYQITAVRRMVGAEAPRRMA
ncbi:MAG TPA: recombinase family protein [Dyella sp.]|uniref:recombinase family protein n=1 Tax=Dyella sp. TaxID=1869338 RepID=UPI002D779B0D|nr:recombinase family protein [Dyella sp.]HET6553416.1 recombinase family protein [Dyella sp.]